MQQQEEAPLTDSRLVGTKRTAPHRLVEESTKNCLKVRLPLLPHLISTPTQNKKDSADLPPQADLPESH